jgi:hypothetical protein
MDIPARRGLVDELTLQDQRQRGLGARSAVREGLRLGMTGKGEVVVVAALEVRSAAFWVAPDAVFQHFVPDIAAARVRRGGIAAYLVGVENRGRDNGLHHGSMILLGQPMAKMSRGVGIPLYSDCLLPDAGGIGYARGVRFGRIRRAGRPKGAEGATAPVNSQAEGPFLTTDSGEFPGGPGTPKG